MQLVKISPQLFLMVVLLIFHPAATVYGQCMSGWETCPRCHGTGVEDLCAYCNKYNGSCPNPCSRPCPKCGGTGRISCTPSYKPQDPQHYPPYLPQLPRGQERLSLRWSDSEIRYEVSDMQNIGGQALLRISLQDRATGRNIGKYFWKAHFSASLGQVDIQGELNVPWDSKTPYSHTHTVHLRFKRSNFGTVAVEHCNSGGCYRVDVR